MPLTHLLKTTLSTIAFATALSSICDESVYAANIQTSATTSAQSAHIPMREEFQVGSLYVEKYANPNAKGAPIILVPGLSSGSYVWDETVKQLREGHELYVLTLAGFNGKPAINGAKLPKAKESLIDLIQSRHIDRPVLVGHSLGSAMSIWLAETHSNLIRGVFAVDGLPVFPGTQNLTPEQRKTMAEASRQQMANADAQTYATQQLRYMQATGVVNPQLAEQIAARSAKSDPVATADYMAELLMMDTRPDLPKIQVPVTVVSPYHAPDFARANMSEESKTQYYMGLVQGIPKLKLVSISDARHFVMLDQPKKFHDALMTFLQEL
ncbi:alpha/beta fold hydrolase [Undibacterium fentianense]|uniref:Alpha/beta hydrolase n=1 Tax=Undibacterium fentianense TaxID=2828728 RepID=A0A941E336_9BURK|nr:alpha/beta hydrolase [Undibacterium fentianense]MBR7801425.1 alpha/beta hydrolase [Undibacterium fentianense]